MLIQVDQESGSFSLNLATDNAWGWKGLSPGLQLRLGTEQPRFTEILQEPGETRISATYSNGLVETLSLTAEGARVVLRRKIHNPGIASISIQMPFMTKRGDDGGPTFDLDVLMHARYAHLDNLRTERFPKCRPEYPFLRPLPWQSMEFGSQESQVAPYMIFTTDEQRIFLLEGQLDQKQTRCSWELGLNHSGHSLATYRLNWTFPGAGGITLHAGDSLELEPVLYQIFSDSSMDAVIRGYGQAVVQQLGWESRRNPLNHTAFYCSWNYGIARSITHESLMKTARFTKDNFPAITHFLIDGGWVPWEMGKGPHLGNFNLPADEVYDREKFPCGMKGIAGDIRDIGLKPALHWTPFLRLNTKLAQEHAGWLCRDATGDLYRIGNYGYLDYSLPEVQEFFHHVFRTIFKEWGFEALKMDFWSQSVEATEIRYRHGGTGIHWRDWLLSTIESYLPEDGFLMTCVAVAMGNPFLGKHAHTYRCGIDVGIADWKHHVLASIWTQPMLAADERSMALHNLDGFGYTDKMTDNENLHRLTYGFISMGSLELDGRFEELEERHVDWLRRLSAHIDRGHAVHTVDDQVNTGLPLPKCLYVTYPEDSLSYQRGVRQHIALFNWSDDPQYIGAANEALGLSGETTVRDFWTDEIKTFPATGICELIPARSARLYERT